MIDAETGALHLDVPNLDAPHLDNRIVLAPGDPIDSVLAIDAPQPLESRDMGNGWTWITARNLQADGLYFIVSVAFYEGVLTRASMVVQRDEFGPPTWANWTPERDREALAFMESWLTAELGDRRQFTWGRVGASIDAKTGQGVSIWISYA